MNRFFLALAALTTACSGAYSVDNVCLTSVKAQCHFEFACCTETERNFIAGNGFGQSVKAASSSPRRDSTRACAIRAPASSRNARSASSTRSAPTTANGSSPTAEASSAPVYRVQLDSSEGRWFVWSTSSPSFDTASLTDGSLGIRADRARVESMSLSAPFASIASGDGVDLASIDARVTKIASEPCFAGATSCTAN